MEWCELLWGLGYRAGTESSKDQNSLSVCSQDGLQGNSLFCLCPAEECFPFWKRIMEWWFPLLLYLKILFLVWNCIDGRLRMLHRYFPFGSNCNCYWLFPALKPVISFAIPFPWPQLFSGLVWKSCWQMQLFLHDSKQLVGLLRVESDW